MPSYRGVSQADLLNSINEALALLETHSTGPVCQKFIDGLRVVDAAGQSKLGAIAVAQDDAALVKALHASGVQWLFMRAGDVLTFHALSNTDGKGLDVLKNLAAWGCMGGMMTMELNQYDIEFQAFLKKNAAHNIFNAVTGKQLPYFETAMRNFSIEMPELTVGKIKWDDETVHTLSGRVAKALEPFNALDEVGMTAVGIIGSLDGGFKPGITPQGIVFVATVRAAQAVADAVPDMQVKDLDGKVLSPWSKPQSPKGPTL